MKNKKRRRISIVLCLLLLSTMLSTTSIAYHDVDSDPGPPENEETQEIPETPVENTLEEDQQNDTGDPAANTTGSNVENSNAGKGGIRSFGGPGGLEIPKNSIDYGSAYDHIDVKVDGQYTVNVNAKDYTFPGILDAKSIVVTIGTKVYDYSRLTVTSRQEAGRYEYEVKVLDLSPSSIAWVSGTYQMSNVVISARMLFTEANTPTILKDILPKIKINNTDYYYAEINSMKYTGIQECTGGRGMRSEGKSGTPTGLDLYITAKDTGSYISKGKLSVQKVIVNEAGTIITDREPFSFTIKGTNTGNTYSKTILVKGGETVTLTDVPAGRYTITETQKAGYAIRSTGGGDSNYSKDFIITEKQDTSIVLTKFTNTKLTDKAAINLKKTASGLGTGVSYPNPTVSIYAVDENKMKIGNALWSGVLPANGDTLYPTVYFSPGTYLVEETGEDVDGYNCSSSLLVNNEASASKQFTVTEGGETIALVMNNVYTEKPKTPSMVELTARKEMDGMDALGNDFTFLLKEADGRTIQTVNNRDGLIEFEALMFNQEGSYTYTISEETGTDKKIDYDNTIYTVIVDVTLEEKYVAEVTYLKNDVPYEGELVFTNRTKPGRLVVSKTVSGNGADKKEEFTFTVTLSMPKYELMEEDMENLNMDDPGVSVGNMTYGDAEFIDRKVTFTLKHGESKVFEGLPSGCMYSVTEHDNDYVTTVNGMNAKAAEGVISAGETAYAAFDNCKEKNTRHDKMITKTKIDKTPRTGDDVKLMASVIRMAVSLIVLFLIGFVLVKRRSRSK